MPMRLSAVLVTYRSAALALRAIESLRDAAPEPVEVIAVVNSGDRAEAEALGPAADRVLLPERNVGYAGGLNRGIAAASGDVLLLCNPDLVLEPGSIAPLAALAVSGRVMAGPVFFWDDSRTILLPPAEEPRPAVLARRALAGTAAGRERVFRRGLRHARHQAEVAREGRTVERTALSGALMAVSRATLGVVGPFDEAYALYYEENDWQRRLRDRGGRLVQAGAARVVHRYNQSARTEPRAAAWFAASERRYFTTHLGERGERALGLVAPGPAEPEPPGLPGGVLCAGHRGAWSVAVSPLPSFHPFAFVPGVDAAEWRLPADVAAGLTGTWFVRAVDASGRVLAEGSVGPGHPPEV